MTLIHCEHCGTRIAPHDSKCPTKQPIGLHLDGHPAYRNDDGTVRKGDLIGHVGENFLHYQPLENPWPTPEAIVTPSPHKTVMSVTGPWCQCGYNPRDEHPDAEPGQLFAYIGQHIRAINDARRI
jgi:hypothetical protein